MATSSPSCVLSVTLCELFPTRLRTSGIGLPYAICAAIFGGTAPLIATWLQSHQLTGVLALYIMAIAAMSGVTFIVMRETLGTPLD